MDGNLNGQSDPLEMPLANVLITLTGYDLVGNPINQTATTDAAGNFVFGNLVPGECRLAETQPAAYLDGADRVGSLGALCTRTPSIRYSSMRTKMAPDMTSGKTVCCQAWSPSSSFWPETVA